VKKLRGRARAVRGNIPSANNYPIRNRQHFRGRCACHVDADILVTRRQFPRLWPCVFSKHYPPENYVIGALSDSLKLMAGWVLRWLSAVRTRLSQLLELLLEFIVLRHQVAVLQRTGTRHPCFRRSERLFWGAPVAPVGKLAVQSDHRTASNRFAWAPSRLLCNLGIRLM
jgi:hypothetical protein